MKIEYQRDVWDEELKRYVTLVTLTDGLKYAAFDARCLRSKYAVLECLIRCTEALEALDE